MNRVEIDAKEMVAGKVELLNADLRRVTGVIEFHEDRANYKTWKGCITAANESRAIVETAKIEKKMLETMIEALSTMKF